MLNLRKYTRRILNEEKIIPKTKMESVEFLVKNYRKRGQRSREKDRDRDRLKRDRENERHRNLESKKGEELLIQLNIGV